MKKHIIFIIIWALAGAFAFASGGDVIVKIEKGDRLKTVNVQLANLQNQRTEVAIQDVDGKLWFSNYVWNEIGYAAKLNLNGLPNGDYILFVANRKGLWTQAFSMTPEDLAFFEKPAKTNVKAIASLVSYRVDERGKLITHFTEEGRMTLGVQLANLQGRPAEVSIVTVGYGSVYSKTVKGQIGYAHPINLEGITSGDYFLYVRSGDATVVQFFTIKNNELTLKGIQRLERPRYTPPVTDGVISGR